MWSLTLENVPATVDVSTIVTELDNVNSNDVTIAWTDVGNGTFTTAVSKASVHTSIGVDFGGDGILQVSKDLPAQPQSDTVADDAAAAESSETFIVTVEPASSGLGNRYIIDGKEAPQIFLEPGKTYAFDLSHSSTTNHPFAFKPSNAEWDLEIETVGAIGVDQIINVTVPSEASGQLEYYCIQHPGMGSLTVFDASEASSAFTVKNVGTSDETVLQFFIADTIAADYSTDGKSVGSIDVTLAFGQDGDGDGVIDAPGTGATYQALSFADGFLDATNEADASSGSISVAGINIQGFSDFDKPIFTMTLTDNDKQKDFLLDISGLVVDGEVMDGISLPVESIVGSTVKTRKGMDLSDVVVVVTPEDGTPTTTVSVDGKISAAISATSDSIMTATLSYSDEVFLPPATEGGDAIRITKAIGASDALDALKLAVGLETGNIAEGDTKGTAYELIAADFNQDNKVSAQDALAILKYAVGMDDAIDPQWVFVDGATDYDTETTELSKSSVSVPDHVTINAVDEDKSVDLVAILVGDVGDSFSASYTPEV
jgi:hypothetical protein